MYPPCSQRRLLDAPRVVATVHCPDDLDVASRLDAGQGIDLLELRLDCLGGHLDRAQCLAESESRLPILVTARGAAEGGGDPGLDLAGRAALYNRFLPYASAIDIELADAVSLAGIVADARASGTLVIISRHDFQKTPDRQAIAALRGQALATGADIFKLASHMTSADDIARLLRLVTEHPGETAAMGMGSLGMPTRLLLACAGSRLNYGYLSRPNAPGQWQAIRFAELLRECTCTPTQS